MKEETRIKYEKGKELYLKGDMSLAKIGKLLTIHKGRFSKYLKEQGIEVINKQNLPNMNENAFEEIKTEEQAYWLGFLYADGYISKDNHIELKLSIVDYSHLEKFAKFIDYKKDINTGIANKKAFCRINFRNKKMNHDLISLGCTNSKSLNLNFPSNKQVPQNLIHHFIRGYIDGDGSVFQSPNDKPRFSFLGTREIIEGIVKTMSWKQNKIRKPSGAYSTEYGGWHVYEIIKPLYKDSTIYLDRKYQSFLKIENAVLSRNT